MTMGTKTRRVLWWGVLGWRVLCTSAMFLSIIQSHCLLYCGITVTANTVILGVYCECWTLLSLCDTVVIIGRICTKSALWMCIFNVAAFFIVGSGPFYYLKWLTWFFCNFYQTLGGGIFTLYVIITYEAVLPAWHNSVLYWHHCFAVTVYPNSDFERNK